MLRPLFTKTTLKHTTHSLLQFNQQAHHSDLPSFYSFKCPICTWVISLVSPHPFFSWQREMHSRNKKAMELIAKGWSALKEVDRVIDYCELNDRRLIPLLRVMNIRSLIQINSFERLQFFTRSILSYGSSFRYFNVNLRRGGLYR